MQRRAFFLVPFALAAQTPRPKVEIVWIKSRNIPDDFARDSIVFPRAYTSCPTEGPARRALETGKFPHAARPQDPALSSFFAPGDTITDLITVISAESGNGEDSSSERSIHVPLAIRWPGKLTPRTINSLLISHVDILPTLLAWAGIAAPEGLQGRDLSALIANRQGELPDSIYSEGKRGEPEEWRAIVRGFDKLIFTPSGEATHLYNLSEDPAEERNLLRDRDHALTRDAMLALSRRWMRQLTDGLDPSGLRLRN